MLWAPAGPPLYVVSVDRIKKYVNIKNNEERGSKCQIKQMYILVKKT
jgi:hypothetical protein